MRDVLEEILKNCEGVLAGGLPHFSKRDLASIVAYRARYALGLPFAATPHPGADAMSAKGTSAALDHWIERFHEALVQYSVPREDGDYFVPATRRVARLMAEEFAPKCVLCGRRDSLATRCGACDELDGPETGHD